MTDGPARTRHPGATRWQPSDRRRRDAGVTRYLEWLAAERGQSFGAPRAAGPAATPAIPATRVEWLDDDPAERPVGEAEAAAVWRWSVDDPAAFWDSIWDFCAVRGERGPDPALGGPGRGGSWFPGATLNFADNALARRGRSPALIAVREDVTTTVVSWNELRAGVGAAAAGLVRLGVRPGDVVCAVLPNCAQAIIAMLAAASVGAVWSAVAPEAGLDAAATSLGPLSPTVLLVADGYHRSGFPHDAVPDLPDLAAALPTLAATVVVGWVSPDDAAERAAKAGVTGVVGWDDLLAEPAGGAGGRVGRAPAGAPLPLGAPLPFDAPLWVTFPPAAGGEPGATPVGPVVHGHGGTVLDHLKTLALHLDLGPDDRLLVNPSAGWEWAVSGLLTGSTVVLYDGDPDYPDPSTLWRLADAAQVTCFATDAAQLSAHIAGGVIPRALADLSGLRTLVSFGGPPAGFDDWVHEAVGEEVYPAPVARGGTVGGALAAGLPIAPSRPGEIGPPALGYALAVADPDGRPVAGGYGELVVTRPVPALPLALWDDPGGARLRAHCALPGGGWRTGTRARLTPAGTVVLPDAG